MKVTVSVAALILIGGCQKQATDVPSAAVDQSDRKASSAAPRPKLSDAELVAFVEAKNCFIDTMMNSMNQDAGGGAFRVNKVLADAFLEDVVRTGSRIGRDKEQVMEELRSTVSESAASTASMVEADKQKYVRATHSHALDCLRAKKAALQG